MTLSIPALQELRNKQSDGDRFDDGTKIYITGPSWPSTVNVNDAPVNPWSKQHWNLTHQGQIYRHDRANAMRLARAAGHKDALSARFKNAK
jgi:hypothetical protein